MEDAVDTGAVVVQYDTGDDVKSKAEVTQKTFAISSVLDTATGRRVKFQEAIERGLLSRDEATFYDTKSGENLFIVDAMKRQLVRARVVENRDVIDGHLLRMRSTSIESFDTASQ